VPPASGIAAPSSDHTNRREAPALPRNPRQQRLRPAHGLDDQGNHDNGPIPTISIMFSATASFRPARAREHFFRLYCPSSSVRRE